jgi:hypothetical protein
MHRDVAAHYADRTGAAVCIDGDDPAAVRDAAAAFAALARDPSKRRRMSAAGRRKVGAKMDEVLESLAGACGVTKLHPKTKGGEHS